MRIEEERRSIEDEGSRKRGRIEETEEGREED